MIHNRLENDNICQYNQVYNVVALLCNTKWLVVLDQKRQDVLSI